MKYFTIISLTFIFIFSGCNNGTSDLATSTITWECTAYPELAVFKASI